MENKKTNKTGTLRTILLMIVSLLVAFLLWAFVTEERGEDIDWTFYGVSVKFEGEETLRESRGLIVSESSATTARVNLKGSRRTVTALDSADLLVTVNVSDITTAGNYSRSPRVTYTTRLDTGSITSYHTEPETIDFYVDVLKSKPVEVMGEFNGSAAEGYIAGRLQISPNTINVYGPEKVLAEIDRAYVDVTRTEVDRTLTFDSEYVLLDANGNKLSTDELSFDTETVSVTLPINSVREVALTVDLLYGGGVAEDNVKVRLEPDTITLAGDAEALSGLNSISVASVDLSLIPEDTYTETFRVLIPNGTEIISGASETELTLELGGLYKQDFTIAKGNISITNVSEGYHAEIVNDSLNVTIRGKADEVRSLSALNIRAIADLTEYGTATGVVEVPVRVSISSSTGVGAVGEYTVYVNITESAGDTG